MGKHTDYQVTLQIPAAHLSANRKVRTRTSSDVGCILIKSPLRTERVVFVVQRGAIVSEPAIQVRRKGKGTQVWTIEKLENKLVDMRDQYRDWKDGGRDTVRDTNKCVRNIV